VCVCVCVCICDVYVYVGWVSRDPDLLPSITSIPHRPSDSIRTDAAALAGAEAVEVVAALVQGRVPL